jgi:hypothetical protein
MRVWTKAERESFGIAFEYIARVVTVTYTTEKIHEIKVQDRATKKTSPIPQPIRDMFLKAGVRKMQEIFMPYKKEQVIDMLGKKFLNDKIQPQEYIFDGLLVIEPIKVAMSSYAHFSAGGSA